MTSRSPTTPRSISASDGGIRGQKRKQAGGGGGGKAGGPGGASYESAVAGNIQQIDMNGHAIGPISPTCSSRDPCATPRS